MANQLIVFFALFVFLCKLIIKFLKNFFSNALFNLRHFVFFFGPVCHKFSHLIVYMHWKLVCEF